MAKAYVTASEYVQTLKHSFIPTVITEGSDDYAVFRRIEERFAAIGLSLMPVGGKRTVLEIFRHRNEFPQIQVAFIVDQDTWLFSHIPSEYKDPSLIVTDGYSIENDLYRDGDMESLLLAHERADFQRDLEQIIKWFSYAVRKHIEGHESLLDYHPNQVVDASGKMLTDLPHRCGYTAPCPIFFADPVNQLCSPVAWKNITELAGKVRLSRKQGH
ncbi:MULTISPECIES: DUF4435 domain-containing protein [Bradyrhizobium]|jgi:uncharacterized protein DUF4435|uniref:DUF4435 domain-containing protein n=1 Tax=Bradyrhizobium TaxID=374 RepID=UPI00048826C6|nr:MULTISPECIES: DUF4435 domain-containing protein [Bradyrhizobium]MCS3451767.1 hypothetical protein [Bradyrhizobium elkanii]MCS3566134.1 hypothetical protein [Bradyrhizobium elkanii]MCW2153136.1 hypothetical protein [Bradyrhizobium elkanii]MCW2357125.1 hypothetical protein [Bradyrhizobium elkanii]MCW2376869.1 hypothetical protein [Bradyrhizobium elkanii]